MSAEPIGASFRDPHGFVFRRGSVIYRQVNEPHRANFDRFISSGLYERLVEPGLLISHTDCDVSLAASEGAYRIIQPELVPFVSYPYEWSFEMLRDAALATLRIQGLAIDHGMSLRDATAYNLTFHRGRPVFLDTTSFEILQEGRPWVAYRQFCQHFVAPLALMSLRDVRLSQLSRIFVDGIPLDLASGLLPRRANMKPGLVLHLRMHAKSQARHQAEERSPERTPTLSRNALIGLIRSLRKTVERFDPPSNSSVWRDYYRGADHYTPAAIQRKEAVVADWLQKLNPRMVWDLGANTGRFARLASERGVHTLAFDADPACVDVAYTTARKEGDEYLLPLVQDLTNPSSGIGWAGRERDSLEDRGPADVVMALALVHHLAIGNNVPLPSIMDHLARLGRWAIVEFVPKGDQKVETLLRSREDVFPDYTMDGFEAGASASFNLRGREDLDDSGRVLYLFEHR